MQHRTVASIGQTILLLPLFFALPAGVANWPWHKLHLFDHRLNVRRHVADEVHRVVVARRVKQLYVDLVVAEVVNHEVGVQLDLSEFGRARSIEPVNDLVSIFLGHHHCGNANAAASAIVTQDSFGQVHVVLFTDDQGHRAAVPLDVSRLPDIAAVPVVFDHVEGRHATTLKVLPCFLHHIIRKIKLRVAAV